jgi:hypothetical protein
MIIASTPQNGQGAGGDLLYTIAEADAATPLTVEILGGPAANVVVGTKRFRGQSGYEVNIAPYIRRAIDVKPPAETTPGVYESPGFYTAGALRIDGVLSPTTIFTAGVKTPVMTKTLSEGPMEQAIAVGEIDYLSVAVTRGTMVTYNEVPRAGAPPRPVVATKDCVYTYVFNTAANLKKGDKVELLYAGAGGAYRARTYHIVERAPNSVRMCWLNPCGGLDSYTFSRDDTERLAVRKNRAKTARGTETFGSSAETLIALRSEWESIDTLRWLMQIIASPRVWISEGGVFRPVDVVTESTTLTAVAPGRLEITVRDSNNAKTHLL